MEMQLIYVHIGKRMNEEGKCHVKSPCTRSENTIFLKEMCVEQIYSAGANETYSQAS